MAHFIPAGFTEVTPYVAVADVDAELDFMRHAFGATEVYRLTGPGGEPVHVELAVGSARILVGRAPRADRVSTGMICVYVPDVNAAFGRAAAMPVASVAMPLGDQFYGDRAGDVRSANGVLWHLASHREDLSAAQIQDRLSAQMRK